MTDMEFKTTETPVKKRSCLMWGCGIAVAGAIIILTCMYLGARVYLNMKVRSRLTPEQYAEMERFFTEPVDVPMEWFEVEGIPESLIETGKEVKTRFNQSQVTSYDFSFYERLQQGGELTPAEIAQYSASLEAMRPLYSSLGKLVSHPDYDISMMNAPAAPVNALLPDFLSLQTNCKFLCTYAYAMADKGDWEEAFQANLAAHRLAKRRPASTLIAHLIGIAIQDIASTCTQNLAVRCGNPALHQSMLDELNNLAPDVNLSIMERGTVVDMIGILYEAKRDGFPVEITPEMTGKYLFKKNFEYQMWKSKQVQTPAASPYSRMQFLMTVSNILGLNDDMLHMLHAISNPNFDNARVREWVSQSNYDIARLTLASSIFYLKNGEYPESASNLATEYFEREPLDPFAGKSFSWDPSINNFYGIGPDRVHEIPMTAYAPSNGITSSGSIFPVINRKP